MRCLFELCLSNVSNYKCWYWHRWRHDSFSHTHMQHIISILHRIKSFFFSLCFGFVGFVQRWLVNWNIVKLHAITSSQAPSTFNCVTATACENSWIIYVISPGNEEEAEGNAEKTKKEEEENRHFHSFVECVCVCVLLQRVCAVKSAREEWPEIRRQILQRTFHLATPTCIRANKNWKRNFIETKSKYVTAENKSVVSFITLSLVLLSTFSAFIPPPHGANEIPNQFVDNKSFAMDWYRFIFLYFFFCCFFDWLVSDHFIYAILWKMKAVHTISDYIFRHQRCYWKTSTWKNTSETKIKIAAATKKQNRNENEISYNFDRIE